MNKAYGTVTTKNGKWYTILYYYDENGERKCSWKGTGLSSKGNKRQVKEMLDERIEEFNSNEAKKIAKKMLENNTVSEDIPFYLYVPIWLQSMKNKIDLTTYEGYCSYAYKHVIPYFKEEGSSVKEMTRKKIQRFIDELSISGNVRTGKGLTYASIKRIKTVVKQTLDMAVKDEIIFTNPCNLIEMPKNEKREPVFLSLEEAKKLLDAIKDEDIYPIIKIDLMSGLRRSEIMGLKWENIDFVNDKFRICHTVTKVKTLVKKDKTKNQTSKRTLCMSAEIKKLLLDIKQKQDINRELFGNGYIDSDYVFTWPDGHTISVDYVTRKFGQILKKHGLKQMRFHDLRHSCASILLSAGCELKDVQEQLGHAEISMTADIYGHLDEGRKRTIANAMEGLIS